MPVYQDAEFIRPVKRWVDTVVIGLNFCPFARLEQNQTRYSVCYDRKIKTALVTLKTELEYLQAHPGIVTSLLIMAAGFDDFNRYLELVERANDFLDQQGYRGDFQLASFHPLYQFDGEAADDPSNYTNRAPFPVLHLLRESEIESALATYRQPEKIPQRNITKARELGSQSLQQKLNDCLEYQDQDYTNPLKP
ncbi:DUF1415 domain-containing protein [Lacimicrobium alkaliphilum]|uniref:DUF1415 domain-containing protein n=1 Tax=Lacimicrobium alkaliphilum TaxID=1526571 RepID=A0ABQ1R523_9ALTE|nr:DUF1415 domain-containing protein [Lacimicrobium alkaliphilum]